VAGTLELSGHNLIRRENRLCAIETAAARYMTSLRGIDRPKVWLHWRPLTPDGLPIIDVTPSLSNVYIACGHGMLGITQAAGTARLVSAVALGKEPGIPIGYFVASRLGRQPISA